MSLNLFEVCMRLTLGIWPVIDLVRDIDQAWNSAGIWRDTVFSYSGIGMSLFYARILREFIFRLIWRVNVSRDIFASFKLITSVAS